MSAVRRRLLVGSRKLAQRRLFNRNVVVRFLFDDAADFNARRNAFSLVTFDFKKI